MKQKDKKPDEKEPIYVLVQRINTISSRMKRMLKFPTRSWKRNIYTSFFVEAFMDEQEHHS